MTKNQTRFSYRSYLTIINITKMYSGTFDCLADERSASSYAYTPDKKSLKLRVVSKNFLKSFFSVIDPNSTLISINYQ